MDALLNVFLLSLFAGLGSGVGGLIVLIKKPGKKLFGFLMGLTAGVMLSLAFFGLLNEAWELGGFQTATIGFAVGAFFMFGIDFITPHIRFFEKENGKFNIPLLKTGALVAIGIAVHNIPEGFAVGAGYMFQPEFGIFIALAIALHNIPEGVATALPLCKGGFSKKKSFLVALFSGLVEPIGAVVAALFLVSFKDLVPVSLAFAAGVMVFLTLDEIVPAAREFGHQHFTAVGIILGVIFVLMLSGIFGI